MANRFRFQHRNIIIKRACPVPQAWTLLIECVVQTILKSNALLAMQMMRLSMLVAWNGRLLWVNKADIFSQKLFKRVKIRSSTHAVLFIWLINKPTLASQHAC